MPTDKEKFVKNYTGMYNAEKYYEYLQEKKENEERYRNATFNAAENRRMLKEANQKAFNRYLRK